MDSIDCFRLGCPGIPPDPRQFQHEARQLWIAGDTLRCAQQLRILPGTVPVSYTHLSVYWRKLGLELQLAEAIC